jgi:hypothetical protein
MATLKINRGTTFAFTVNYLKDGAPASLVGATVRFTVKATEFTADMDDSDAVITRDLTNGTVEGTVTFTLNPADTEALLPRDYFYDIKVEEAGGAIYKLDEGKIRLDGSPTNRRTS